MPTIRDRLFVVLQRLLPARMLGRWVSALADIRAPWIKDWQIRWLVRTYGIDTAEAARPVPAGYATLNEFFVRELRPGARTADAEPGAVCSPADGRIEQLGEIRQGDLLQAKAFRYRLEQLLAIDGDAAAAYNGGSFITIYLAPHNYHRVHMPLAGTLHEMVHVPGRRLAVNPRTVGVVPGLFAANERVVCHGTSQGSPFAVVLVGALNVASISLAFRGLVTGRADGKPAREPVGVRGQGLAMVAGQLLGQFNLGSTVIVCASPGLARWAPELRPGQALRVGQRIGLRQVV